MKKGLLLIAVTATTAANAQLTLPASPYTQDFNTLTTAVPTGWTLYNNATATTIGTMQTLNKSVNYGIFADTVSNSAACLTAVYDGNFRNYPSANVVTKSATCTEQKAITDRALGVRQIGSGGWDAGASFNLQLANTTTATAFSLDFKLQSLDTTSARVTTWKVQYGFGSSPTTWTDAPTVTGTMTTGGFIFSNNPVHVDFGTTLNNKTTPVWIRIVTLDPSTGSNRRASTAIDDFKLTYTGGTSAVADVTATTELNLMVLGTPASDKVTFGFNIAESGKYNLTIYDLAGRTVHAETINATSGSQQLTVNGLNLSKGMYIAKIGNGTSSSIAKVVVQ